LLLAEFGDGVLQRWGFFIPAILRNMLPAILSILLPAMTLKKRSRRHATKSTRDDPAVSCKCERPGGTQRRTLDAGPSHPARVQRQPAGCSRRPCPPTHRSPHTFFPPPTTPLHWKGRRQQRRRPFPFIKYADPF